MGSTGILAGPEVSAALHRSAEAGAVDHPPQPPLDRSAASLPKGSHGREQQHPESASVHVAPCPGRTQAAARAAAAASNKNRAAAEEAITRAVADALHLMGALKPALPLMSAASTKVRSFRLERPALPHCRAAVQTHTRSRWARCERRGRCEVSAREECGL